MPGPDSKISILLNGGVDNRSLSEFIAPIVTQGQGPKLVESTNTRLSKTPGTCARAPKVTTVVTDTVVSYERDGIIPSKTGRNAVLMAPHRQMRIISGDGGGGVGEGISTNSQGALGLARISAAGALESHSCYAVPAVSMNATSGVVWRAYPDASFSSTRFFYVSAWSEAGAFYGTSVASGGMSTSVIAWIGMTSHGASGDRVWYTHSTGICYRTVTLSGTTVTVGAEVVVCVPGSATTGLHVVSGETGFAYLVHSTVGVAADATVRRVNIATGATTHSATIVGALNGGGHCAVHYSTLTGAGRVLVAYSRVTGATTTIALYDSTLTVVSAATTVAQYGQVTCCLVGSTSSPYANVFVSSVVGDFAAAPAAAYDTTAFIGTRFWVTTLAAWSFATFLPYPWQTLVNHAAVWQNTYLSSSSVHYAVIELGRCYGSTSPGPGEANYVDDPSISMFIPAINGGASTPIARYGVVRGGALPAQVIPQACLSSSGTYASGDRIHVTYKRTPLIYDASGSYPARSSARWVTVDLTAFQPPLAYDKDGATLVAAAYPVVYDGANMSEMSTPAAYAPRIAASTGGPVLAAGVYRACAVWTWTDASGCLRRSRPSNIISKTCNGASDTFSVVSTTPDTLLKYSGSLRITVYVSEVNGTSVHHYSDVSADTYTTTVSIATAGDASKPAIYSTAGAGEEVVPQVAPPLRDIAIVGSRAVGIDAEYPTRIVYSKLRVAGVGYELFPAGEVILPSGAGDAMAVRGWQGMIVILAENGVYQVAGDGPNNMGVGSFAPPVKVSDIGCSNTASAIEFPGGIMWQSSGRFAMLSGGGIDYVPDFNCEYDVTVALLLRRHDEVALFSNTVAGARVYNYAVKKWTTWDSQVIPSPVTGGAVFPWDEDKAYLHFDSTGIVARLDVDSTSTCTSMTWRTDRMLLGGDFQEHVIFRDVVFSANIGGPHSITIEMYVDDETTASTTRTWTSSQLSAAATAQGDGTRYTVRFEPQKQAGRSVRFKVYDTVAGGEVNRAGVQPKALTLIYASNGQLYQEVFNSDSRQ